MSVGSPNSWRNRRVAIPPTRLSSQRSVNEHRVIAPRRARTVSNRRRTAAPRRRIIPAPAAKTRASAIRRSDRKRRLAKPKLVTTSDSMMTHRTSRASPWSASDRDRGGRSGSSAIKDTIIGSGADTTASTSSRWKDSAIRRAIATCSRRSSRGPCCPRRVTCRRGRPAPQLFGRGNVDDSPEPLASNAGEARGAGRAGPRAHGATQPPMPSIEQRDQR